MSCGIATMGKFSPQIISEKIVMSGGGRTVMEIRPKVRISNIRYKEEEEINIEVISMREV